MTVWAAVRQSHMLNEAMSSMSRRYVSNKSGPNHYPDRDEYTFNGTHSGYTKDVKTQVKWTFIGARQKLYIYIFTDVAGKPA